MIPVTPVPDFRYLFLGVISETLDVIPVTNLDVIFRMLFLVHSRRSNENLAILRTFSGRLSDVMACPLLQFFWYLFLIGHTFWIFLWGAGIASSFILEITPNVKPRCCCNFLHWFFKFKIFNSLFYFRGKFRRCFRFHKIFEWLFWVVSMIAGSIVRSFYSFFFWKRSITYIFPKITFSAELVDASVSHRWSMDAYIPRYTDVPGAGVVLRTPFLRNRRLIDSHVEKWRLACWGEYRGLPVGSHGVSVWVVPKNPKKYKITLTISKKYVMWGEGGEGKRTEVWLVWFDFSQFSPNEIITCLLSQGKRSKHLKPACYWWQWRGTKPPPSTSSYSRSFEPAAVANICHISLSC